MRTEFLLAAAWLAAPAAASPAPALPEPAPARSAPGWIRKARSLLLYGPDGALLSEISLRGEEFGRKTVEVLGGASPDGGFAWTLERRTTWDGARARALESRRLLRVHGSDGRELWRDADADAPENGEAAAFSADGKVILLARRDDKGWSVEARNWMGTPLLSAGPFPTLISIALTRGGRFALARWAVTDRSDTHTFLDLAARARRDVPSAEFPLGVARLEEDGTARSGLLARTIFPAAEPPAPAPAVSSGTAAEPR